VEVEVAGLKEKDNPDREGKRDRVTDRWKRGKTVTDETLLSSQMVGKERMTRTEENLFLLKSELVHEGSRRGRRGWVSILRI
jgi:hypothetical protein